MLDLSYTTDVVNFTESKVDLNFKFGSYDQIISTIRYLTFNRKFTQAVEVIYRAQRDLKLSLIESRKLSIICVAILINNSDQPLNALSILSHDKIECIHILDISWLTLLHFKPFGRYEAHNSDFYIVLESCLSLIHYFLQENLYHKQILYNESLICLLLAINRPYKFEVSCKSSHKQLLSSTFAILSTICDCFSHNRRGIGFQDLEEIVHCFSQPCMEYILSSICFLSQNKQSSNSSLCPSKIHSPSSLQNKKKTHENPGIFSLESLTYPPILNSNPFTPSEWIYNEVETAVDLIIRLIASLYALSVDSSLTSPVWIFENMFFSSSIVKRSDRFYDLSKLSASSAFPQMISSENEQIAGIYVFEYLLSNYMHSFNQFQSPAFACQNNEIYSSNNSHALSFLFEPMHHLYSIILSPTSQNKKNIDQSKYESNSFTHWLEKCLLCDDSIKSWTPYEQNRTMIHKSMFMVTNILQLMKLCTGNATVLKIAGKFLHCLEDSSFAQSYLQDRVISWIPTLNLLFGTAIQHEDQIRIDFDDNGDKSSHVLDNYGGVNNKCSESVGFKHEKIKNLTSDYFSKSPPYYYCDDINEEDEDDDGIEMLVSRLISERHKKYNQSSNCVTHQNINNRRGLYSPYIAHDNNNVKHKDDLNLHQQFPRGTQKVLNDANNSERQSVCSSISASKHCINNETTTKVHPDLNSSFKKVTHFHQISHNSPTNDDVKLFHNESSSNTKIIKHSVSERQHNLLSQTKSSSFSSSSSSSENPLDMISNGKTVVGLWATAFECFAHLWINLPSHLKPPACVWILRPFKQLMILFDGGCLTAVEDGVCNPLTTNELALSPLVECLISVTQFAIGILEEYHHNGIKSEFRRQFLEVNDILYTLTNFLTKTTKFFYYLIRLIKSYPSNVSSLTNLTNLLCRFLTEIHIHKVNLTTKDNYVTSDSINSRLASLSLSFIEQKNLTSLSIFCPISFKSLLDVGIRQFDAFTIIKSISSLLLTINERFNEMNESIKDKSPSIDINKITRGLNVCDRMSFSNEDIIHNPIWFLTMAFNRFEVLTEEQKLYFGDECNSLMWNELTNTICNLISSKKSMFIGLYALQKLFTHTLNVSYSFPTHLISPLDKIVSALFELSSDLKRDSIHDIDVSMPSHHVLKLIESPIDDNIEQIDKTSNNTKNSKSLVTTLKLITKMFGLIPDENLSSFDIQVISENLVGALIQFSYSPSLDLSVRAFVSDFFDFSTKSLSLFSKIAQFCPFGPVNAIIRHSESELCRPSFVEIFKNFNEVPLLANHELSSFQFTVNIYIDILLQCHPFLDYEHFSKTPSNIFPLKITSFIVKCAAGPASCSLNNKCAKLLKIALSDELPLDGTKTHGMKNLLGGCALDILVDATTTFRTTNNITSNGEIINRENEAEPCVHWWVEYWGAAESEMENNTFFEKSSTHVFANELEFDCERFQIENLKNKSSNSFFSKSAIDFINSLTSSSTTTTKKKKTCLSQDNCHSIDCNLDIDSIRSASFNKLEKHNGAYSLQSPSNPETNESDISTAFNHLQSRINDGHIQNIEESSGGNSSLRVDYQIEDDFLLYDNSQRINNVINNHRNYYRQNQNLTIDKNIYDFGFNNYSISNHVRSVDILVDSSCSKDAALTFDEVDDDIKLISTANYTDIKSNTIDNYNHYYIKNIDCEARLSSIAEDDIENDDEHESRPDDIIDIETDEDEFMVAPPSSNVYFTTSIPQAPTSSKSVKNKVASDNDSGCNGGHGNFHENKITCDCNLCKSNELNADVQQGPLLISFRNSNGAWYIPLTRLKKNRDKMNQNVHSQPQLNTTNFKHEDMVFSPQTFSVSNMDETYICRRPLHGRTRSSVASFKTPFSNFAKDDYLNNPAINKNQVFKQATGTRLQRPWSSESGYKAKLTNKTVNSISCHKQRPQSAIYQKLKHDSIQSSESFSNYNN